MYVHSCLQSLFNGGTAGFVLHAPPLNLDQRAPIRPLHRTGFACAKTCAAFFCFADRRSPNSRRRPQANRAFARGWVTKKTFLQLHSNLQMLLRKQDSVTQCYENRFIIVPTVELSSWIWKYSIHDGHCLLNKEFIKHFVKTQSPKILLLEPRGP